MVFQIKLKVQYDFDTLITHQFQINTTQQVTVAVKRENNIIEKTHGDARHRRLWPLLFLWHIQPSFHSDSTHQTSYLSDLHHHGPYIAYLPITTTTIRTLFFSFQQKTINKPNKFNHDCKKRSRSMVAKVVSAHACKMNKTMWDQGR